jgi:hypothetical protein
MADYKGSTKYIFHICIVLFYIHTMTHATSLYYKEPIKYNQSLILNRIQDQRN